MNDDRKLPNIPRLLSGQLVQAEMARNVWRIHLQSEMKPLDFLRPEAYSHVAKMLARGDKIEVLAEDSSWFAEYLVRTVEGLNVRIALLRLEQFESGTVLIYDEYTVEWNKQAKGRVIRNSDKQVLIDGLPSKDAAEEWLISRCAAPAAEAA